MERFKVVEREIKIKVYFKEGFGVVVKLNFVVKEKLEMINWFSVGYDWDSLCIFWVF